ncbi:hypothetical protein COOONC_24089 [Cooperia oncophora]
MQFNSVGTLCPAPACPGTRSSDVIVDEMAGVEGNTATQISFGSHTLSVLDLDERQRCEARRGAFACVNVARMHLINCRHRFCYDCLSEKIDRDVHHLRTLAHRSTHLRNLCAEAEKLISDPPNDMTASKDEIIVETYLYGREATNKRIIIPKICLVGEI